MSGKVCFPVENRLKLSMVTSRTNRGGRIKIIDRNSREVLICREFNDSDPSVTQSVIPSHFTMIRLEETNANA